MANWNRWGVAAGLAGALALYGVGVGADARDREQRRDEPAGLHAVGDGIEGLVGHHGRRAHERRHLDVERARSAGPSGSTKVDKKLQEDVQRSTPRTRPRSTWARWASSRRPRPR